MEQSTSTSSQSSTDDIASSSLNLGLCLSGGGLRATFFHLGLIRALRDCKNDLGEPLLKRVTHICSVSGGSILAAHLVLNWDKYTGGQAEYNCVESELIKFGGLDIRGRVVRRWLLSILFFPIRFFPQFSHRTKLLQREYQKNLFKNATLSELGGSAELHRPELYILSTSLTTGDLYAFTKFGLNMSGPSKSRAHPLASEQLALAVTASSAFPPLFPPVEIERSKLGASVGEMPHAIDFLTDGGIFDNLGLFQLCTLAEDDGTKINRLIVSDASMEFDWDIKDRYSWITYRTSRSTEIMMKLIGESTLKRADHIHPKIPIDVINISDKISIHANAWLPPEYKNRAKRIRTDLDAFSDVEIETLIQHGYEAAISKLDPISSYLFSHIDSRKNNTISARSLPTIVSLLDKGARRKWRIISVKDPSSYPIILIILIICVSFASSIVGFPFLLKRESNLAQEQKTFRSQEDALLSAIKEGPRVLTADYLEAFRASLADLNLKHLSSAELLFLGKANSDATSTGFQLNSLPPRELWPNIKQTALVLDQFMDIYDINEIEIISAFRSSAYNKALGSSPDSAHMLFYAVDFKVKNKGTPAQWGNILRSIRSEGRFKGGIGISSVFVHLDTRGPLNRDWGE
ncbi:patatin-like phospholipase family protein [Methylopila sp. M107]|uniref:patatin-like phospholipase family protein n=1 Tax=Methylopila sp. M107 TaxID=1101190 RepID=UPI00039E8C5A|nr:patatin-like phospholipase family protein [Methylopila sp. M107]